MEDLIEKWKEYKIAKAEFVFSAGGDSMGDVEMTFYDDKGAEVEVSEDFSNAIDEEVYQNVEFYENSDGHYQGESGTVFIGLEDDELTYTKDAISEYSNSYSDTVTLELTEEEYNYVDNHISDFANDEIDDVTFTYSKDFFITEEMEAIENSIKKKMLHLYENHEFETTDDCGDVGDWVTVSDLDVSTENKIIFSINYQVTEYEDSN